MGIGGNMKNNKRGWKVVFVIIACFVVSAIYDAFTVRDIVAPAHPLFISIFILIADLMILLGAYCYAFNKYLISSKLFWLVVIVFFFIVNGIAVIYELVNNQIGYEVYDMITMAAFYLCFSFLLATPTIMHLKNMNKVQ
ncbi:hypothetical protein P20652_0709 [Pseudoalteromonas sp. BSi20652]|uniref:hypothetical protein n=1 Tax=Pseudoalteromonas sp. BSi20652 TaxID=388384 RepID=UPI000231963D|nr:hypothetical protein [Pseudoalteromonas sp. BSi20652]GAA58850.1 hypothetical protein P20652_0709 [Pseudoalteromonas sp. BSi20652]